MCPQLGQQPLSSQQCARPARAPLLALGMDYYIAAGAPPPPCCSPLPLIAWGLLQPSALAVALQRAVVSLLAATGTVDYAGALYGLNKQVVESLQAGVVAAIAVLGGDLPASAVLDSGAAPLGAQLLASPV